MRNIFDQYSQPENRLTHSLASVLHHDKALLKSFLQEFGLGPRPPVGQLQIIEQGLTGEVELEEGEAIRQGPLRAARGPLPWTPWTSSPLSQLVHFYAATWHIFALPLTASPLRVEHRV